MLRRNPDRGPGLATWLWRAAVTVALLALLLLANLSDSIRVLVGIIFVTGVFVMAYDLFRRSKGPSSP